MEEIYNFLVKECGIKYKDTIVAGISGGPDSMALLYLLNRLKKELDLFLICAHVNHNVREESENERIFLQKYCEDNAIYFEYMKIEGYGEDNFHNEARSIRYDFFDKLMKKYDSKFLFTAHHGDDLIETILMRIVRGSTLKGYSGFSKIVNKNGYKIIRPFITTTKDELIKYDKKNHIKYATDESNKKDVYTRNRYRKYVLPFLKSEDSNVHEKFLKFSEILLENNKYIESQASSVINSVFKQGKLDIEKFLKLESIIQSKILYNILEQIYTDDLIIISDVHVKLIFHLIKSNKSSSCVHLPNNVVATKAYNYLTFGFDEKQADAYEVEINDIVNLPSGKNIELVSTCEWTNNNVIRLNSNEIELPLHVRSRRNGDKMQIKNMLGSKKINDIFIDEKINQKLRETWPIVCDAKNNIVWLPGLKKSKFDKEQNGEYDIILRYY